MNMPYILVIDDEPDIRNLVKEILEDESYEVGVAENGAAAQQALKQRRPDLVLLDIWMPDIDGITLLKEWSKQGSLPYPVIMMSGHGTVETAVEATRLGAYNFLEKPLSLAKLLLIIERALEANKLHRENITLRKQVHLVIEPIGKSSVMQHLREQAKRIAQHDTWMLISGESGSGKETFARYLHANSPRRDGPFIDVGGASISRDNSAIELFGNEEQEQIHYGFLEQAHGGTLFIDAISDMELETQARLLSALETGSYYRVGGAQPIHVNVRVLAATHKDLEVEVRERRFREDLYYHLNVVPLHIPPLREHCEDVPELLQFYVDYLARHEKMAFRRFSMLAQNRLRNYVWPGNIRELKNLVQRLLILGAGEEIGIEEVDAALGSHPQQPNTTQTTLVDFNQSLRDYREQCEKIYLAYHLQESNGSVGKLAKLAGMERTHLYRKLRALNIDPKEK